MCVNAPCLSIDQLLMCFRWCNWSKNFSQLCKLGCRQLGLMMVYIVRFVSGSTSDSSEDIPFVPNASKMSRCFLSGLKNFAISRRRWNNYTKNEWPWSYQVRDTLKAYLVFALLPAMIRSFCRFPCLWERVSFPAQFQTLHPVGESLLYCLPHFWCIILSRFLDEIVSEDSTSRNVPRRLRLSCYVNHEICGCGFAGFRALATPLPLNLERRNLGRCGGITVRWAPVQQRGEFDPDQFLARVKSVKCAELVEIGTQGLTASTLSSLLRRTGLPLRLR
jgi:hypothetical protein